MNRLQSIGEELAAIIALVIPALKALGNSNAIEFEVAFYSSVILALVLYFAAWGCGKLWYKNYKLSLLQHFFWAVASVVSGLGVMVWVAGKYLQPGLALILLGWQGLVNQDADWINTTFKACYEAVEKTGVEDFTNYPPPSEGGSRIPLSKSESRLADARVVVDRASQHFAKMFPALGRLLDADEGLGLPTSELKKDVDEFFDSGEQVLPMERSVQICARMLTQLFAERSAALVVLTQIMAVGIPGVTWIFLFGWVGRSARCIMDGKIVKRSHR